MASESDDPLSTPSNASTVSAMFLEADGFWDGKQYRWACQVDEYGNISHTFTIIRLDI